MRLDYPLWIALVAIFVLSSCSKPAADIPIASKNLEGKTRYCPFCKRQVSVADSKASKLSDNLGHFHMWLGDKQKALDMVKKANLSEIYQKGAEKGSLPLQVLLQISKDNRDKIGQPLTRYSNVKEDPRDVIFNFAHYKPKKSVFCPACQVMVSPKNHDHGRTAYNSESLSERPYDFEKGIFWAKTGDENNMASKNQGGAQWCLRCKTKMSNNGHIHGKTHYCEVCNVEVFNVGHIHGETQYCSNPKCQGGQAVYGLEKKGHVHGWTQFCPLCRADLPYEEIYVHDGGGRETVKGFVHDMIVVIRDDSANKKLRELRQKLKFHKLEFGGWPSTLDDVEGVPYLGGDQAYEYSRETGNVRIIQVQPAPKVLVIRGNKAKTYPRGYYNRRGRENNAGGSYVEKDPENPFQLKRKVYGIVTVTNYEKRRDELTSSTKAYVGDNIRVSTRSVSLTTPDGMSKSFSGDLILSKAEDAKKLDRDNIFATVNSGSNFTIIKAYTRQIEIRSSGMSKSHQVYHEHAYPLKEVPNNSGGTERKSNRVFQWNFMQEQIQEMSRKENETRTDKQ